MTSINVTVCEAQAYAEKNGKLTTHMVGIPVSFSFDSAWDGLHKYAVFRSGRVVRDRSLLLCDSTTVPHEVLHKADERLFVGVEGRAPDGTLVIPTTWADVGVVLDGANASGVRGSDPTPDAYDDIMAAIKSGILRGPEGPQGPKGDSPVKGVDYHTLEDRDELIEEVTSRVITNARNINIGKLTVNERMKIAALRPDDWQNAMAANDNLAEFAKWIYQCANIDIGYHINSVKSTFDALFNTDENAPQKERYKLLPRTESNKYKLAMLVPGSYGGNAYMAAHGYNYTMESQDYHTGDIFCARFLSGNSNGSAASECDYMAVCLGNMFLAYINYGGNMAAETYYIMAEDIEDLVYGRTEGKTLSYCYVLRLENAAVEDAISLKQDLLQIKNDTIGLAGAICNTNYGETVVVSDAEHRGLSNLVLYGKTTQNGTPTPDATFDLVSAGDGGSIEVTITDGTDANIQSMAVSTPNGLSGVPVSTGGNYTDSNGQQWVCDEIDFAKGVYVKRTATVALGELDWTYREQYGFFTSTTLSHVSTIHANGLCTHYKVVKKAYSNLGDKELVIKDTGFSSSNYVYVKDSSYTDGAALKAAMRGAILLYQLAEPIETPLSAVELKAYALLHTNKLNTTVYTDSNAGVKMEYVADTKAYIDNKFAELAAVIAANA